MEAVNQFIEQISNGDPVFFYLLSGIFLLLLIFFMRKMLMIIGIFVGLFLAFIAWQHFTGNPVPLEIPEDLNIDNIVKFARETIDYLLSLIPAPTEGGGSNPSDLVGGAVEEAAP